MDAIEDHRTLNSTDTSYGSVGGYFGTASGNADGGTPETGGTLGYRK